MALGNTAERWGWLAQCLHWLMALGLIGNLVLGSYAEDLPLSLEKVKLFLWHKSIGITLLALVLARIVWRWRQPTPELPPMPRWQKGLAHASHALLYLMMLALPLSGWVMNSAADFPLKWFGLFELPPLVGASDDLKKTMAQFHELFGWILISVVVLHVLAAVKHVVIDKDNVLRRMLPGG